MTTPRDQSGPKRFAKRPRPLQKNDEKRKQENLRELRRSLYSLKLVNSFWFDGELPEDPVAPFDLYLNLDWPHRAPHPTMRGNIKHLTESQLRFIAGQLKRPDWVTHFSDTRTTVTVSDGLVLTGQRQVMIDPMKILFSD